MPFHRSRSMGYSKAIKWYILRMEKIHQRPTENTRRTTQQMKLRSVNSSPLPHTSFTLDAFCLIKWETGVKFNTLQLSSKVRDRVHFLSTIHTWYSLTGCLSGTNVNTAYCTKVEASGTWARNWTQTLVPRFFVHKPTKFTGYGIVLDTKFERPTVPSQVSSPL